jgi:hypothetical protein
LSRTLFVPLTVALLAVTAGCSRDSATGPLPSSAPQLDIVAANAPSGAHFRRGSDDPVCSVKGLTVSCTGTAIAGVGNTDANLSLTVSYAATVNCRNHGGQIVAVKTQGTSVTPAPDATTDLRNGTLYVSAFGASTVPTDQSSKDAATCPNGNWTKEFQAGSPTVASFIYTLAFVGFEPNAAITVTG